MDKRIGEVFDYKGVKLVAVEDKNNSCEGCFFKGKTCNSSDDSDFFNNDFFDICDASEDLDIFCTALGRADGKYVIFKKAE